MDRKWTYLLFAGGGLLLAFLVSKTGMWIWDFLGSTDFAGDFVGKPREAFVDLVAVAVGGGLGLAAARNEQLFTLATEVVDELKKVTWPTREETYAATIVVVVTVIVSSVFLGVFDLMWSSLSRLIYG